MAEWRSYVLGVSGGYVGSFTTTARGLSGAVGTGTCGLSLRAVNACDASAPAVRSLVVP